MSRQFISFVTSIVQNIRYVKCVSSIVTFCLAEYFVEGRGHTARGRKFERPLESHHLATRTRYWVVLHSIPAMPLSCLREWVKAHQHHCIHNSQQQDPGLCRISVWQFGNTTTICRYCGEFRFLHLRLCLLEGMFWHTLGIVLGSLCLLGIVCLSCLLQGTVDFEFWIFPWRVLSSCSFHHQVSGLHWWFIGRLQTSVAASSRRIVSFEQN